MVGLGVFTIIGAFSLSASAVGKPTDVPRGPKVTPTPTALNVACIQGAIVERDNAVIASVTTYHTAIINALTARRDAFSAAYAITDRQDRKKALRDALSDFKDARRAASETFRKAKDAAWSEFAKDRKACGVGPQDGQGNSKLDSAI